MKKLLIFLFVGILLMGSASAGLDCWWDNAKINTDIQLIQKCPSCSYVNITSITYPNGTVFLNELMQQQGINFNYTLPDSSQTGKISYGTIGDKNGASTPLEQTLCIEITKTGTVLETQETLVYFILAFGVFFLFALSFYFMVTVPYKNNINTNGAVIQITKLKYIKLGFIMLTWILLTWFLNILISLSDNFVSITIYYGFFGFIFEVMNNLALPLGIFIIVLSFFEIIRDANIQKAIEKFGVSE